jgi:hypothetical protein
MRVGCKMTTVVLELRFDMAVDPGQDPRARWGTVVAGSAV